MKIISGGQTGADRAALEWAINAGYWHGGWCPLNRRAEDGMIPLEFNMWETRTSNYMERTEANIRCSDGTVIFTMDETLSPGSKATLAACERVGKPVLHLNCSKTNFVLALDLINFISTNQIGALNVAGSRESKAPGIGGRVKSVLTEFHRMTYSV